ncbi:TQO small subunit DoxA domain-containing protein [Saccharolobus caldissimus]|uniref:Quinol oxidase n=1 Tax=Saccharolobus caldissimus TaxID=1702097 RepID=A0AAQ4CTG4_9CREN|nr:TQO small subunit DoxA domain-containing protein [Saccharolobus caldissimus]BDB99095.1 quinol oxidase [Saccharolobus caldissimus]
MSKAYTVAAAIFSLIVIILILVVGQVSYGNVVGPLFNNSKKPKIIVCPENTELYNIGNFTFLKLNITDIDGPDAYPASVTMIVIKNSTFTLILNTEALSKSVVNITKAPWDLKKAVGYNDYSGIYLCLGTDAVFTLKLPAHLYPGSYEVILYVPALPHADYSTTLTLSDH